MSRFKALGPSSEEAANAIDIQTSSVLYLDKMYSIKLDDVNTVLEDLGNFVITAINEAGINAMMPNYKIHSNLHC